MILSQNKAKQLARCTWLNKCLDEYFAPGQFLYDRSHVVDVKWRSDGYYAVVLFEVNGGLYVADVAGTRNGHYEVCNDSEECYGGVAQWKSVRIDPYCDGFDWAESSATEGE